MSKAHNRINIYDDSIITPYELEQLGYLPTNLYTNMLNHIHVTLATTAVGRATVVAYNNPYNTATAIRNTAISDSVTAGLIRATGKEFALSIQAPQLAELNLSDDTVDLLHKKIQKSVTNATHRINGKNSRRNKHADYIDQVRNEARILIEHAERLTNCKILCPALLVAPVKYRRLRKAHVARQYRIATLGNELLKNPYLPFINAAELVNFKRPNASDLLDHSNMTLADLASFNNKVYRTLRDLSNALGASATDTVLRQEIKMSLGTFACLQPNTKPLTDAQITALIRRCTQHANPKHMLYIK